MWTERFADFLCRWRVPLFGVWVVHMFLIHYYFLGYVTWDGFGHRGFPLVELIQHGTMGKEKFHEWSLVGYTPFVELAQLPFLYLFKMRGFIIAFPLVVFPLCVVAVFAFMRELTGDERAATFGAFAYAAMPMINAQPYSGYVDFSVSGWLAFFLWALLRLRVAEPRWRAYGLLVLASFVFTMSRVQAVYVVIIVFPLLAYVLYCERERFRLRIKEPRKLLLASAATALGAIPAIGLQIYKYLEFGSPTYPIQFSMLGIKLGDGGFTRDYYFQLAGLGGDDLGSVAKGFLDGWVWHGEWPIGGFYTSVYMAAGLLFILAVLLSPFVVKKITRLEWWMLGGFAGVSWLARDFGVPRWSYTIVIALVIVLGRAMSELTVSRRWRPVFWGAAVVMMLHLLRPEIDYLQLKSYPVSPRMNVTGSAHFFQSYDVPIFPDHHAKLVIVEAPNSNFMLALYGKTFTNEILGTVWGKDIGARCANLRSYVAAEPTVLFVDDYDFMKDCPKECGLIAKGQCRGWHLLP